MQVLQNENEIEENSKLFLLRPSEFLECQKVFKNRVFSFINAPIRAFRNFQWCDSLNQGLWKENPVNKLIFNATKTKHRVFWIALAIAISIFFISNNVVNCYKLIFLFSLLFGAQQDIMCQLKDHQNTFKTGQRVPTGILGQGTPKRQRPTHQVRSPLIGLTGS